MHHFFRKLIFLVCLTLFVLLQNSIAADESRVLIILKGHDSKSAFINHNFEEQSQQAKNLYKKLGFKVIELDEGEETLTGERLTSTLTALKAAKEVHIVVLEHGISDYGKTFNLQTESQNISGDIIKNALEKMIEENPNVKIYMPILSCYAGALIEKLANLPGFLSLSSSSWNRPTITSDNENPIKNLFDSLSNHNEYNAAEEFAWKKQFKLLTTPLVSISLFSYIGQNSLLPMPMGELPLPKTQSELFLNAWCSENVDVIKKEVSENCPRLKSVSVHVSDDMKNVLLKIIGENSSLHAIEIEGLSLQLGCDSFVPPNPDTAKLDAFLMKAVGKLIGNLEGDIEKISFPELKKNMFDGAQEDLKKIQMKIAKKEDDEESLKMKMKSIEEMNPYSFALEKSKSMSDIRTFKDYCLNSVGESIANGRKAVCKKYFNELQGLFRSFSPKRMTDPSSDDGGFEPKISSEISLRDYFAAYSHQFIEKLKKDVGSEVYFDDLSTGFEIKLPEIKEYCKIVKGSLEEADRDRKCMQEFKKGAPPEAWARLLEIYNLSHRSLQKEGAK